MEVSVALLAPLAPCTHLRPAWGPGAHRTGLRTGKAGADAEFSQKAGRTEVDLHPLGSITNPTQGEAISPEPDVLHPSQQTAGPATVCSCEMPGFSQDPAPP